MVEIITHRLYSHNHYYPLLLTSIIIDLEELNICFTFFYFIIILILDIMISTRLLLLNFKCEDYCFCQYYSFFFLSFFPNEV